MGVDLKAVSLVVNYSYRREMTSAEYYRRAGRVWQEGWSVARGSSDYYV